MRHHATPIPACYVAGAVAGLAVCVPAAPAYAIAWEGVTDRMAAAPLATFGTGCAVGAVLGGLAVGLANRRTKRRLRAELDEVVAAAERAERAAAHAEQLMAERSQTRAGANPAVVQAAAEQPAVAGEQTTVIAREQIARAESQSARAESQSVSAVAEQSVSAGQATDVAGQAAPRRGRSVRALLHERLGADALEALPVIDRGAERAPSAHDFVNPHRVPRMSKTERAAEINRRVPRFDESLFPDVTADMHAGMDSFEVAMRAMEDSMPHPVVQHDADYLGFSASADRPEITDAQSYVDYLVQDEMERNRSESARRYSRSHLTVFEGTGDLNAMRRVAQHQARHLVPAQKEA